MASLPPSHSYLSLHLTDSTLTPLLSSASTSFPTPQSDSLSALTAASLSMYTSAARLGLGLPQRVMLETRNGPLVLHSFLNPQQPQARALRQDPDSHLALVEETRGALRPLSASTDVDTEVGGGSDTYEGSDDGILEIAAGTARTVANGLETVKDMEIGEEEEHDDGGVAPSAPLLIATVVAPRRENMGEARRAAAGLERIGVRFQRQWIKEQQADRDLERETEQEDG